MFKNVKMFPTKNVRQTNKQNKYKIPDWVIPIRVSRTNAIDYVIFVYVEMETTTTVKRYISTRLSFQSANKTISHAVVFGTQIRKQIPNKTF